MQTTSKMEKPTEIKDKHNVFLDRAIHKLWAPSGFYTWIEMKLWHRVIKHLRMTMIMSFGKYLCESTIANTNAGVLATVTFRGLCGMCGWGGVGWGRGQKTGLSTLIF